VDETGIGTGVVPRYTTDGGGKWIMIPGSALAGAGHTQNTDSGTNADTWIVNSDGTATETGYLKFPGMSLAFSPTKLPSAVDITVSDSMGIERAFVLTSNERFPGYYGGNRYMRMVTGAGGSNSLVVAGTAGDDGTAFATTGDMYVGASTGLTAQTDGTYYMRFLNKATGPGFRGIGVGGVWSLAYSADGSTWVGLGATAPETKVVQFTVVDAENLPTMAGRSTKSMPQWTNEDNLRRFVITKITAKSDEDDYTFTLFESNGADDMGTSTDTRIDVVACSTNGTSVFTASIATGFDSTTVNPGSSIIFEHTSGTCGYVKVTIAGRLE
jgi:hypothetical protein